MLYEETPEYYKTLTEHAVGIPKVKTPSIPDINMTDAELVAFYSERYDGSKNNLEYNFCNIVKNGEFYLDIGCSDGSQMELLFKKGIHGIGLDLSITSILLGRMRYPHLKFIHGFAEEIPFKNCHFDVTILGDVIEHLRNPKAALAECLRVARKSIAISIPLKKESMHDRINPLSEQEILDLLKFFKLEIQPLEGKEWFSIRAEKTKDTDAIVKNVLNNEGGEVERKAKREILEKDQWENYLKHTRHETEIARFSLVSHLIEGNRVLEIGCGNGDGSVMMLKQDFDVVGIDISRLGIKQGVDIAAKENVQQKASFFVMDATRLAFPDNSFDSIVIPEVLEHIRSPRKILEEAIRVVRNGGRIIISVPYGLLVPWEGHLRVFFKDTLTTELSQYAKEIMWHELSFKKWFICSFFVNKKELDIEDGPLVDIIMPTYNGKETIRKAIISVIDQTFRNWNLIVVNDGGEDIKDIIETFRDKQIKYLITEHKGKASALNFGIGNSHGKYITYLDDDDILYPIHLETLIRAAETGHDFVYADTYLVNIKNDKEVERKFEFRADVTPEMLLTVNYINHKCILHSRSILQQVELYDEYINILIDWDFIRRLAFISPPFHIWSVTSEHLIYLNDKGNFENRITSLWRKDPNIVLQSIQRIVEKSKDIPIAESQLKRALIKSLSGEGYAYAIIDQKYRGQIAELNNNLQSRDSEIKVLKNRIQENSAMITGLEAQITGLEVQITGLEAQLQSIYQSITWRLVMRYHKIIENIFPYGTRRRHYYYLAFNSVRIISNEGIRSFLRKFKEKISPSINELLKNKENTRKPTNELFDIFEPDDENSLIKNEEIKNFQYQPKISVIMPVYNTDRRWLTKALNSVIEQIYDNWELCIADDSSTKVDIKEILVDYSKKDARIKVKYLNENVGISGATNEALSLATGEFITLLDHDDELTKGALYEIVKLLNDHPDADIIYSDDDKIDVKGRSYDFQYKPDWSPELLLSYCYFSHIKVLRRSLVEEIGGFRKEYDGSQDYDLLLRAVERTDKIHHIPKILYHWRSIPGSVAYSTDEKPKSIETGRKAVEDAIRRRGISGEVIVPEYAQKSKNGIYKINFKLENEPKISIIIPTKDKLDLLKRCINSIENKTTYKNYEIVIVDTGSKEEETLKYLNKSKHKVLPLTLEQFNFSKINNYAVSKVDSEFVLLLNNDTEVISDNWIQEMLGYILSDPKIGAVGAKLIFENEKIQHAGVVLGLNNGLAGHANKLIHCKQGGYLNYAMVARNYSAVTAACLLTRKKYYEEVGGLDEDNLEVAYNDVDLCLKMIQKGYRIVFNPFALLYHHEGASRGTGAGNDNPREEEFFKNKWRYWIEKDPYYNPNLSLENEKFNIKKLSENTLIIPSAKNLLFISHNLNLEGAPFIQYYLAKNLIKRGYKITLISPYDGPLKMFYLDTGVEVNILKTSLDKTKMKNAFASWMKTKRYGLVFINTILNYRFIDLIHYSRIPIIWEIQESEREHYFSYCIGLSPDNFKNVKNVVFASNVTRKIYKDLEYNGNFSTIHNGVDIKAVELFKQKNDKLNLRKKYNFSNNSKIVTIVGTTCERKGQKVFIEAALKLLDGQNNSDIQFLIVGAREGEYLKQLKRIIAKSNFSANIHLVPETRDVFDYYFISDIFVCASFIESFPMVILEAMAFELPIIAPNVYGIPEEIEDGKSGILIEPGNPEHLATKIKFLLENDKIADNYSKVAFNRVKSLFTMEKMVDEYEKLFIKVFR